MIIKSPIRQAQGKKIKNLPTNFIRAGSRMETSIGKISKIRSEDGFSLVEVLIAIAIIITSTTVVLAILTSSFRTSNKSTSLEIVRQNGTNALNQITKTVSYADSFVEAGSVSTCPLSPAGSYKTIEVNVQEQGKLVKKTISCSDTDLRIRDNLSDESLLSTQVKMEPGSCNFTCAQDNEAVSPVIGVSFTLSTGAGSTPEKKASLNFSTSIKMRNL